ncbi:MAG: hypothetical protein ACREKS_02815 [Candidatus Rokuibacteriota bacterium]
MSPPLLQHTAALATSNAPRVTRQRPLREDPPGHSGLNAPPAWAKLWREIMIIDSLVVGHYRIALPTALSDSTHGTITHFELITVRLADRDGAMGHGVQLDWRALGDVQVT